jgi:glycosyltransferase involved in cell wall biosynthesis
VPYAIKTLGVGLLEALGSRSGVLGPMLAPLHLSLVRGLVQGALAIDTTGDERNLQHFADRFGLGRDKIALVGNAVDTARFYPAPAHQARALLGIERFDPVIGFVGARPWERGGMQLIEAAPALLQKYPALGVVVVGPDSEDRPLRRRAEELGVLDHCLLPGYVPFEHIPQYINAFTVGVSLLLAFDTVQYGIEELKIRQYTACGKPAIAGLRTNGYLEAAGLGTLVDPRNNVAIVQALNHWLSKSPAELEALCDRAVAYARAHLAVQHTIEKRLAFWEERLRLLAEITGTRAG